MKSTWNLMCYCYNFCESILILKLKIMFIMSYILVENRTPGGRGGRERREGYFPEDIVHVTFYLLYSIVITFTYYLPKKCRE